MRRLLLIFSLAVFCFGSSSALFAKGNTLDDMFPVLSVEDGKATVKGDTKGLKAGDYLYFSKSPYQFKVESVEGEQAVVIVPPGSDLKEGQSLFRHDNAQIRKNIQTEKALKSALEE